MGADVTLPAGEPAALPATLAVDPVPIAEPPAAAASQPLAEAAAAPAPAQAADLVTPEPVPVAAAPAAQDPDADEPDVEESLSAAAPAPAPGVQALGGKKVVYAAPAQRVAPVPEVPVPFLTFPKKALVVEPKPITMPKVKLVKSPPVKVRCVCVCVCGWVWPHPHTGGKGAWQGAQADLHSPPSHPLSPSHKTTTTQVSGVRLPPPQVVRIAPKAMPDKVVNNYVKPGLLAPQVVIGEKVKPAMPLLVAPEIRTFVPLKAVSGPPVGVTGPSVAVPGPPVVVPVPGLPKKKAVSGPPVAVPGPPVAVPGPPVAVPGPLVAVPGPPVAVPGLRKLGLPKKKAVSGPPLPDSGVVGPYAPYVVG